MSRFKTIVPRKVVGQEYEEVSLAAETLPGTLVSIAGTQELGYTGTKQAVRGQSSFVVYENELFGKTCRDAIAANERAQCLQLVPGMKFTGIVKANVAIVVGDILTPAADGLVDKCAAAVAGAAGVTPDFVDTFPVPAESLSVPQLFIAEEACLQAATGDARRILLRVLR